MKRTPQYTKSALVPRLHQNKAGEGEQSEGWHALRSPGLTPVEWKKQFDRDYPGLREELRTDLVRQDVTRLICTLQNSPALRMVVLHALEDDPLAHEEEEARIVRVTEIGRRLKKRYQEGVAQTKRRYRNPDDKAASAAGKRLFEKYQQNNKRNRNEAFSQTCQAFLDENHRMANDRKKRALKNFAVRVCKANPKLKLAIDEITSQFLTTLIRPKNKR